MKLSFSALAALCALFAPLAAAQKVEHCYFTDAECKEPHEEECQTIHEIKVDGKTCLPWKRSVSPDHTVPQHHYVYSKNDDGETCYETYSGDDDTCTGTAATPICDEWKPNTACRSLPGHVGVYYVEGFKESGAAGVSLFAAAAVTFAAALHTLH